MGCPNITFEHFVIESRCYAINKYLYKVLNFLNNPFPGIASFGDFRLYFQKL